MAILVLAGIAVSACAINYSLEHDAFYTVVGILNFVNVVFSALALYNILPCKKVMNAEKESDK